MSTWLGHCGAMKKRPAFRRFIDARPLEHNSITADFSQNS